MKTALQSHIKRQYYQLHELIIMVKQTWRRRTTFGNISQYIRHFLSNPLKTFEGQWVLRVSFINNSLRTLHVPKTSYYLPPYTIKLDRMCPTIAHKIALWCKEIKLNFVLNVSLKHSRFKALIIAFGPRFRVNPLGNFRPPMVTLGGPTLSH